MFGGLPCERHEMLVLRAFCRFCATKMLFLQRLINVGTRGMAFARFCTVCPCQPSFDWFANPLVSRAPKKELSRREFPPCARSIRQTSV